MLPPETGLDGIDAEHGDLLAAVAHDVHAEHVDESAFASAGHAGDADAQRIAGLGRTPWQNFRGQLAIAFQIAFNDGDGARENHPVALQDPFDVGFGRQASAAAHGRRRTLRVPR